MLADSSIWVRLLHRPEFEMLIISERFKRATPRGWAILRMAAGVDSHFVQREGSARCDLEGLSYAIARQSKSGVKPKSGSGPVPELDRD